LGCGPYFCAFLDGVGQVAGDNEAVPVQAPSHYTEMIGPQRPVEQIDSPVLLAVPHLLRSHQAALDLRKPASDFGVLVLQDVPVLVSCTDQEPKRREDFEERGGRLHTMYA